jgi:hypothetical protein
MECRSISSHIRLVSVIYTVYKRRNIRRETDLPLPSNSYESISVDKKLVKDVRMYIQEFHGYRSPSEFIHEAIRLRLLELDKLRLEKLRLEAESGRK